MAIVEKTGDILESTCHVTAVPTNCVGVMGAGLAKQVKEQYPGVFTVYRHLHDHRQLKINRPDLVRDPETGRLFLLFPTKKHFRDSSEYFWVQQNLQWIQNNYPEGDLQGIASLALPAVGCGLGNLAWDTVKLYIEQYLSTLELEVHVYPPDVTKLPVPNYPPELQWPDPSSSW